MNRQLQRQTEWSMQSDRRAPSELECPGEHDGFLSAGSGSIHRCVAASFAVRQRQRSRNQKSSLEALTSRRDRVMDFDPKGACLRSHRAQPMPAHHQSHRSRGEHAAISSRRRPCRQPVLTLQPARYVHLDQANEAAAVTALADLLAPYVDQPEEEEAA